jgi:hypothetical protein
VQVTVAGLPSENRSVTAVHAPESGAGCLAGETYMVGLTDASGLLTFALPYGTWELQIDSASAGSVTLAPTDLTGPTVFMVAQP